MNPKRRITDIASNVKAFYEHSFIKNARIIIIMSQITCMMPVSGVLSNDLHAIEFSYFSIKLVLFMVVQASVACMAVTYSIVFVRYTCRLKAAGDVSIM